MKQSITNLLDKFLTEKTGIFINGMGIGRITAIESDYLVFEVTKKNTSGKTKKLVKETTYIPLRNIETVSEGEKEIPKTERQKAIENDLEDI